MPFKDIDWGKVAKQTVVSYNIGRTNALINAKTDKNIQKVELLSGTDLVERDPLDEAIQMAQDAISGFVSVLARRGEHIPVEHSNVSPFAVSSC